MNLFRSGVSLALVWFILIAVHIYSFIPNTFLIVIVCIHVHSGCCLFNGNIDIFSPACDLRLTSVDL